MLFLVQFTHYTQRFGAIRGTDNEHQQSCPSLNLLTDPKKQKIDYPEKGGKITTGIEEFRCFQTLQKLAGPMAAEHQSMWKWKWWAVAD